MKGITYYSEQPKDYAQSVSEADTLEKLLEVLTNYQTIAHDAITAAPKNLDEFDDFRTGLEKERRGAFAGEGWATRYSNILLPDILFRVSMVAVQYKVPWGCAFIRLQEVGKLKYDKQGFVLWNEK